MYVCVFMRYRICLFSRTFPHLFISLFLSVVFFVAWYSPRRNITPDRGPISGRAHWEWWHRPANSREPFIPRFSPPISSSTNFCVLTRLDTRRNSSTNWVAPVRYVYPSEVTNYIDNDAVQKKGSTQIRKARSHFVLPTFRIVFDLFFDTLPQLPAWIPPSLFPVYTLMPVITRLYGVWLLHIFEIRVCEREGVKWDRLWHSRCNLKYL